MGILPMNGRAILALRVPVCPTGGMSVLCLQAGEVGGEPAAFFQDLIEG